jgi:Anti-sigma-K factor rskA, C-terminal/Anti-sigma-K factor RskA, N-terminal domain
VGRELSPAELHQLLGAYALDAVDADEREQVEDYLARTPAAAAEVNELQETAALLAHAVREAPPGLWDRIEGALAEDPPHLVLPIAPTDPTGIAPDERTRHRHHRRRLLARTVAVAAGLVAVASITVSVVLQGQMDDQQARLDRLSESVAHDGVARAARAAAMDPASHVATLASADGSRRAKVVTMPDGTGFFMEHNLPKLAPGRTYQLWAATGSHADPVMVSVGVLGRRPAVTAFRTGASPTGFMVTVEPDPGVVQPDEPAMLEGSMD